MDNFIVTQNSIRAKVREAISEEKTLVLTTNNFLRDIEDQLFIFLRCYLEELQLFHCENPIIYAIRELAANANKANVKRLYFIEKKLDINNRDHYKKGMKCFREEAYRDWEKYTPRLREKGIYVKFRFQVTRKDFKITIMNNTRLSVEEENRINDKIHKAWRFESMKEAMIHSLDETEGAGLGIVSIIMMLRNLGIKSENSLKIKKTPTETHSIMSIRYGILADSA